MNVLTIDALTFGYTKNRLIYKDFDLTLNVGEIVCIVGKLEVEKYTF